MLRRNLPIIAVSVLCVLALFYIALPRVHEPCPPAILAEGHPATAAAQQATPQTVPSAVNQYQSPADIAAQNDRNISHIREHNYDGPRSDLSATGDHAPLVIILTPLKNAARHLDKYFAALQRMDYPKHRISLGFLTSDSEDGTHEKLLEHLRAVEPLYRRITVFRKNFHYELSDGERHGWQAQIPRRKVMSMSRNFLLTSIVDEEWVAWWDVDVFTFPDTILQDLIRHDKDVIQPNCYYKMANGEDYPYDLNTWQETPDSRKFQADKKEDEVLLEGYPDVMWTRRLYLNDYRHRQDDIVELDGVGGTFLMVRADVHRAGANFPAFPVKHQLETEGFAKMAKLMGFGIYGLPHYIIYHDNH